MLLAIQVFEARNLPDTDRFILSKLVNSKDVTDPYVSGYLDTTKVGTKKHRTQMLRRFPETTASLRREAPFP